jgi:predicted Rossmann fold nucleotide-binding protein DprA/Smf involved in DNA uptake
MKLAIVGSRTFNDYEKLKNTILSLIDLQDIKQIISGGAKGVDTCRKICKRT